MTDHERPEKPEKMPDLYDEGYWERAVGSNYTQYGDDGGWQVVLGVLRRFAPPPADLVEVACAKGYFVLHARREGYNARGIDLSEYAISKAEAEVQPFVEVGDAVNLPFDDNSADVVCSFEFFEHVFEELVEKVWAEKVRVLRPGGLALMKIGIVIPADHPFAGQADHDKTHYTVRRREEWEKTFATSAGMVRVPEVEEALDVAFHDRDWLGRWFVWRKPLA